VDKCKSYIDLFLPHLSYINDNINDDNILNKCCYIINKLIRYADDCECDGDNDNNKFIIWREFDYWERQKISRKHLFKLFFRYDIFILSDNPNNENAYEKEFSLEELLIDDDKFKIFNDYWNTSFDYYDLSKAIKDVTKYHNVDLPQDLIDIILCYAY
jgi:hypothetical protein